MKSFLFFLSTLFLLNSALSANFDEAKQRCAKQQDGDAIVYNSDFHWGYSLAEMTSRYQELYSGPKRLNQRVYFDEQKGEFILPLERFGGTLPIRLSQETIQAITNHIENSLKLGYTDFPFFPDMGHSHFYIDKDFYEQEVKDLPVKAMNIAYERMLGHPRTRMLYHTVEQLQVEQANGELVLDRYTQWRFYTRNLIGENNTNGHLRIAKALETKGNTVSDYGTGEFHSWSAGYYIHANHQGCFSFNNKGKKEYYDINLSGFPNDGPINDPFKGGGLMNQQTDVNMPIWMWELIQSPAH